jgi:hypothetical protein
MDRFLGGPMSSLRDEISCYLMTLGVGLPDVTDKHAQCILALAVKRLEKAAADWFADNAPTENERRIAREVRDRMIAALKGETCVT